MTTDSIETRVIELVAVKAEVKAERVLLTNRLLDDLGIDGDDAVELFDGVHERFGTDLKHLYERWDEHFGPEGMPVSAGLVIIPAILVGGVVTYVLSGTAGDVVAIIVGLSAAIALLAASTWIARRLGLVKDLAPITVAEIVQAVEAGSWPRPERNSLP